MIAITAILKQTLSILH